MLRCKKSQNGAFQILSTSFRDGPKDQTSDAQLRIGESRDSGFDADASPRNDEVFADERPHSRGVIRPSFASAAPNNRGRRESRASDAPAASRAKVKKHTSKSTTGSPEQAGLPCAMVLTVSFVVSLVIGLSCHHRRRVCPTGLISASRYQDHTTSPSATSAFVSCARRVHRIPRPTLVTIAKRPSFGRGMARMMLVIWGCDQCAPTAAHWHDGQISPEREIAVKHDLARVSAYIAQSVGWAKARWRRVHQRIRALATSRRMG
jgi:hypothetical protein